MKWDHKNESKKELESGVLVLAEPFMQDPNFKRSVVLLCEHNDEGSFGFILNKTIPNVSIKDIVEDFPGMPHSVFYGGPVGTDTLHYIHSLGNQVESSVQIGDNLYWGGDFESLKAVIKSDGTLQNSIRFFVGYSGWSEGQLEAEIEQSSWIISKAKHGVLLDRRHHNLWRTVLSEMGGVYRIMSKYPEHPTLN